ncbi:MAG: conjugal transfer protein TraF [Bacillota bacterium]
MKKTKFVSVVVALVIIASFPVSAEYFTARSLGMGGAYTGMAGDISSVLYNPASVSGESYLELYTSGGARTGQLRELQNLSKSVAGEFGDGYLTAEELENYPEELTGEVQLFAGGGLRYAFLSSIMLADLEAEKSSTAGGIEASVNSNIQRESMLTLGTELTSPPLELGRLALGTNLKLIQREDITFDYSFSEDSEEGDKLLETKGSGTALGADAGILAQITSILNAGLQVKNLYAQDMEMEFQEEEKDYSDGEWETTDSRDDLESEDEDLERSLRAGASLDLPLAGIILAADVDNLLKEDERIYHLGAEKRIIFNALSLRAGRISEQDKDPFYTAGLGLNIWKLHFDLGAGSSDGFDEDGAVFTACRIRI